MYTSSYSFVCQFSSSSKVEAVIKNILALGAADKAIVFSQYTSMIDILEWRVKQEGLKVVKFMGHMPIKERQSVLTALRRSRRSR